MDIFSLEKLSCLHLPQDKKESMEHSIHGVMKMMHEIDNIVLEDINLINPTSTNLVEDSINEDYLVQKSKGALGLHSVDGLFLAPKVIRKE